MSEGFSPKRYPRYRRERIGPDEWKLTEIDSEGNPIPDREAVFESAPAATEPDESQEIVDDPKPVTHDGKMMSRRDFLRGSAAVLAVIAGGGVVRGVLLKDENEVTQKLHVEKTAKKEPEQPVEPDKDEQEEVAKESVVESAPTRLTPVEQLREFGEVRDLEAGLKAVYREHYNRYIHDPDVTADLQIATKNMGEYDLQSLAKPFAEEELPTELAYMIPTQETRWKNVESFAGARGLYAIMPETAEAHGYGPEDPYIPEIGSIISAKYFVEEKKRFGNNLDMLLHAYNGGGGLFGFTGRTSKSERVPANFYQYMQRFINGIYKKIVRQGFYEYPFRKNDKTLSKTCEEFNVTLDEVLLRNPSLDPAKIMVGDKIIVPISERNVIDAIKKILRKPFETLNYAPELRAKYDAMKDLGLAAKFEERLEEKNKH